MLLAKDHLARIESRLKEAEVNNQSLLIDIIDHVCCMIEEKVDSGVSYETAEAQVFAEFKVSQIKAIELETELLTQNRIIMKKRTLITGIVALGLILMALFFQVFQLPYGPAVWMFLGMFIAIFGFGTQITIDRFSYSKSSEERIKSILGFIGTGFLLAGIAFHFAAWPFGPNLIISGGVLLFAYFIINNLFSEKRNLQV